MLNVIVVDASVIAVALLDDSPTGDRVRTRLRDEQLYAPDLIYLEVSSVLRRQLRAGRADARRTSLALEDLAAIPMRTAPHRALLSRVWELRDNLTPYDAAYVALAERLDCILLTADAFMSRAPGVHCGFELVPE